MNARFRPFDRLPLLVAIVGLAYMGSGTSPAVQGQEDKAKDAPEAKDEPEGKDAPGEADGARAGDEAPAPDAAADGEARKGEDAASSEPSAYWAVDLDFKALRMVSPTEGAGAGTVYWYMLYTLSNPAKEEREVYVTITAVSDHNREYADTYLPSVEKAIERKEGSLFWGKTDEFAFLAKRKPTDPRYHYIKLKAGEKRSSVAVFNRLDPNANKITIRVNGLSNEIKDVVKDDGKRFLEQRVRELYFERAGDEHAITQDSFKYLGRDWVKRQVALPAVR